MDGSQGDLQTKYHKIAGEYSKVSLIISYVFNVGQQAIVFYNASFYLLYLPVQYLYFLVRLLGQNRDKYCYVYFKYQPIQWLCYLLICLDYFYNDEYNNYY